MLNFTNLKQYNWDFYEEYFDKITYNGRKDSQQIKQIILNFWVRTTIQNKKKLTVKVILPWYAAFTVVYTIHNTLYCAVYCVYYIQYTVKCSVLCTLYTIHCTVQCIVYTIHNTQYILQCSVVWIVYIV